MATTYKGTKITGTSTTSKVFSSSGIKSATLGETYLNTSTGHVYRCTTGGSASTAKWRYVSTPISKKPTVAVSSLGAPVRTTVGTGTHYMKATWSVPSALTDDKKRDRASALDITWHLNISGKKDPDKVIENASTSRTTSQINLNNLTIGSKTYTRASFFPLTDKKLFSVSTVVRPTNDAGDGPVTKATRKFTIPKKPTISAFSFSSTTGTVSCTITTDAGEGYAERYDTRYTVKVKNTRTGKTWNATDTSSTSTSITASYDASDYQQLSNTQYIQVTVTAWARGYAGISDKVSKTYYVAFPAAATITSTDITSKTSSGRCVVRLKTNNSTQHPVDSVKLEYLADTTYPTATSIPGTATWTDAGIEDNAQCSALAVSVTNLIPDPGNYTWVRVKTYHAAESVLVRYSNYMRLKALETPEKTATDEEVTILSATAGADGQSAVVLLAWNEDGDDDADGTELTWSEDEDTWKSTEEPNTHLFTWSDGSVTSGTTTYEDSAEITIKGLAEATKYYIRARRYTDGDTTTYSDYSDTATVFTSETPEAVTATCDQYIPSGQPLSVYWTFSGNSLQKEWQIVSDDDVVIAKGSGSAGSARISADRLAAVATNNEITFTVQVSSGSGMVESDECTVTIVDIPELSITASTSMTAQPYSFTATVTELSDLIVVVTSSGAMSQFPDGIHMQTAGDTIYSELVAPAWTENANDFSATVTLPEGLDFWDYVDYDLTVTAVDRSTGLRSEEAEATFTVDWTSKATAPEDTVTLTPVDTTDEDGNHTLAVQIALTAPASSVGTDVYDIYRMDGGMARLIGEGFPLSYTAMDYFAPYGDGELLYYRIALRTVDGDVAFSDIEYDLPVDVLRFDWRDGSVELPYNLSIGDGYSKDADIRSHMDGSVDGYWNPTITRKASLSTDVIKLEQQSEIEAVRQLARYAGPVFVRTPNASAFEADVQVTNLSADSGHITSVAFDATEIGLTQEFILATPFTLEDEEEEEE